MKDYMKDDNKYILDKISNIKKETSSKKNWKHNENYASLLKVKEGGLK